MEFSFVKEPSTTHAIQTDVGTSLVIALNNKNAFNSAAWKQIIEALNKKEYIVITSDTIRKYFRERKIIQVAHKCRCLTGVYFGPYTVEHFVRWRS